MFAIHDPLIHQRLNWYDTTPENWRVMSPKKGPFLKESSLKATISSGERGMLKPQSVVLK